MAKNEKERSFDKKLIEVYDTRGIEMFLRVCSSMLNIKDSEDFQKKMRVNGEVCEVLIRVLTEHYLVQNRIKGKVFHSLVLNNKAHPENPFRTELDFTLLTPYFCITAECKSFVGTVTATGDGLLTRTAPRLKTLTADVSKQTGVHTRALMPYLKDYVYPNTGLAVPPLYPIVFMFSNGMLNDSRTRAAKNALPILTATGLFQYYDLVRKSCTKEVYDVKKASKTFQAMADSRILHIQHANYLGY